MGSDVHMIGESRWGSGSEWSMFTIPEHFQERNYAFFAAIGNVRNGFGVAGAKIFTPITPISDNRGLPDDMGKFARVFFSDEFYENDCPLEGIIDAGGGDHSTSYITLREIKAYGWPLVEFRGVMTLDDYKGWDRENIPKEYVQGVYGGITKVINPEDIEDSVGDFDYYVNVTWVAPLVRTDLVKDFIRYLELNIPWDRDEDSIDNVRILFNFDS